MKWILICVLVVVIMLIAYSISEQYRDRYDFYNNLKQFLSQFKLNLNFKQQTVTNFLDSIKARKNFKNFVSAYKNYIKTDEINLTNIKLLTEDEKTQLEEMIKSIGSLDVINETKQIDSYLIITENKLTETLKEKEKLCPLIIKLSLLFSIGLAILLI